MNSFQYNFSITLLYQSRKQFYFIVFNLKILNHENYDNNLQSPSITIIRNIIPYRICNNLLVMINISLEVNIWYQSKNRSFFLSLYVLFEKFSNTNYLGIGFQISPNSQAFQKIKINNYSSSYQIRSIDLLDTGKLLTD